MIILFNSFLFKKIGYGRKMKRTYAKEGDWIFVTSYVTYLIQDTGTQLY